MLPEGLWVLPPEGGSGGWPWTALWPRPAAGELAGVLAAGAALAAELDRFIAALEALLG